MNTDSSSEPSQRSLTGNILGSNTITRAMLHARTRELAAKAGRIPPDVTQTDYEQAKRELTGEADLDLQNPFLD